MRTCEPVPLEPSFVELEPLAAMVGIPGGSQGGSQGDGIHMAGIGKTEDGFSGISHQRDLSKREHREHRVMSERRSSEGHRPTGEDIGWIWMDQIQPLESLMFRSDE